jgi:hypothetical protein
MPARIAHESNLRAVVSVSELARMIGLSRSHFHALMKNGVMPRPVYCLHTRRPLFTRELQEQALLVKQTNIGIDGRYVCFYAPRQRDIPPQRNNRRLRPVVEQHVELLSGLRSLGISDISDSQVESALTACFPNGVIGTDDGHVLRAVWQHLRRPHGG